MESNRENNQALIVITSFNKILSSVNNLKDLVKTLDERNQNLALSILHGIVEPIYDVFPDRAPSNPLAVLHDTGKKLPLLDNHLPNQIDLGLIEKNLATITSVMKLVPKLSSGKANKSIVNTFDVINTALKDITVAVATLQSPSATMEQKHEPTQNILTSNTILQEEKGSPSTAPFNSPEEIAASPILMLPEETLLSIMSFLRPKDTLAVARVASKYFKISEDASLWQQYLQQDFNVKETNFDELTQKYGSLKAAWLAMTVEAGTQAYVVIRHDKKQDKDPFDPTTLICMRDMDFLIAANDVIGIYPTKEQALDAAKQKSTKNFDCYVCAASEKTPKDSFSNMNNIYRTEYSLSIALYDPVKNDLQTPIIIKLPPQAAIAEETKTPRKDK